MRQYLSRQRYRLWKALTRRRLKRDAMNYPLLISLELGLDDVFRKNGRAAAQQAFAKDEAEHRRVLNLIINNVRWPRYLVRLRGFDGSRRSRSLQYVVVAPNREALDRFLADYGITKDMATVLRLSNTTPVVSPVNHVDVVLHQDGTIQAIREGVNPAIWSELVEVDGVLL